MQPKFTLESFKESFVWKVNDSGTRQIKEPVLSGSEEPVPTPNFDWLDWSRDVLRCTLTGWTDPGMF